MRKNAYKDILDFLIAVNRNAARGQHLKRLQTMAGLAHSCIKSKKCSLEHLSQPRQTCRATDKDSLLQQTKRWLGNKWDLGEMACHYYKRRFQIETMFKQLKSKGFQLHQTRLEGPAKISNLITVVATAFVFTFCLGGFLKKKYCARWPKKRKSKTWASSNSHRPLGTMLSIPP
jgi:hypothetical protein